MTEQPRPATGESRREERALRREALEALQLSKLNRLLERIVPANRFYRGKFGDAPPRIASLADLADLPFTTKDDLIAAEAAGDWRTFPAERYVRFHQTSGTSGRPLPVLDTADDWRWWIETWQHVLDAAGVAPGGVALLAFSFGPFIGFWSAFDALVSRGVRVVPGGGLDTRGRLEMIERTRPAYLFCTPTYALHLAEAASALGASTADSSIRKVVVAGEPGGSIPATRARIERAWTADVVDHSGASEIGPWGFGDAYTPNDDIEPTPGLRVVESEFIAEFLSVETGRPAASGELAHLVLTNLGRVGTPVVRYRTGDLVRPTWPDDPGGGFVRLEGGVLGRADDMLVIRGVNVFPSAIEQILGGFPEVVEHRVTARKRGEMDEVVVEVEDRLQQPERIADELRLRLGLRVEVRLAPAMSLPRSAGTKSRRFVDERRSP